MPWKESIAIWIGKRVFYEMNIVLKKFKERRLDLYLYKRNWRNIPLCFHIANEVERKYGKDKCSARLFNSEARSDKYSKQVNRWRGMSVPPPEESRLISLLTSHISKEEEFYWKLGVDFWDKYAFKDRFKHFLDSVVDGVRHRLL